MPDRYHAHRSLEGRLQVHTSAPPCPTPSPAHHLQSRPAPPWEGAGAGSLHPIRCSGAALRHPDSFSGGEPLLHLNTRKICCLENFRKICCLETGVSDLHVHAQSICSAYARGASQEHQTATARSCSRPSPTRAVMTRTRRTCVTACSRVRAGGGNGSLL